MISSSKKSSSLHGQRLICEDSIVQWVEVAFGIHKATRTTTETKCLLRICLEKGGAVVRRPTDGIMARGRGSGYLYILRKPSHTISQISSPRGIFESDTHPSDRWRRAFPEFNFLLCTFSTFLSGTHNTEAWSFQTPFPRDGIQTDTREHENRPRNESSNSISNAQIKLPCTRLDFVTKVSYFNFQVL